MKVLGISGSPRKNGNTDIFLKEIFTGARECVTETECIYLRDYVITPCVGCEKCRKDLTCSQFHDGMTLLYVKVEEADVLVLGSPVYNYNITAQMKSFIDRLYPYYLFSNDRPRKYHSRLSDKKRFCLVFSICEQTDPKEMGFAIEAMARPFEALGYEILEKMPVSGFFDKGAIRNDASVMQTAYALGQKIAVISYG
ncbi:MAG: flavodoxin family protein [Methanomicrobiales archaeon HGW-Methanomicrobiales-4]|nr:MAG: flavodoxin family protein [Methanomicrobiales archaeon HGW-Methanomicrobiales-4]